MASRIKHNEDRTYQGAASFLEANDVPPGVAADLLNDAENFQRTQTWGNVGVSFDIEPGPGFGWLCVIDVQ